MRVHVGHVLFPPEASSLLLSSSALPKKCDVTRNGAKRFKSEECAGDATDAAGVRSLQALTAPVTEAICRALREQKRRDEGNEAVNDDPGVHVQLHAAGKGFSFCFVPGVLSPPSATSAHTALQCSEKVTGEEIRAAASVFKLTALTIVLPSGETWDRLPVYWEERHVTMTETTGPTATTSSSTDRIRGDGCVLAAEEDVQDVEATFFRKRLLVVGAGGIGCELLKVLVLYGFLNLDVFDLDTIDATNLNRQFLFQKEDVGASKAGTARKSILSWFSSTCPGRMTPTIRAHHADIKSDVYDDDFFRQFALVLNALDNVSARQHVNRMCMRVGIPLIESGTMGYNGQVQPILRGLYECYDCHPKAANQQTVAVCTIHARPTTMVHCVHYAKELYERLFGDAQREDNDELAFVDALLAQHQQGETNHKSGKNTDEGLYDVAIALARSLFHEKIQELLAMKSVWATQPPVPLSKDLIHRGAEQRRVYLAAGKFTDVCRDNALSLEDTVVLFIDAFLRCTRRGTRCAFRKEDDDTVDFVAAVTSLRATVFHIGPLQSVEEIRSLAGAIVPAIATTNAIVAAAVVQQALCVLHTNDTTCQFASPQMVYVRRAPQARRRFLPSDFCDENNHNADLGKETYTKTQSKNSGPVARRRRWATDLFLVHSAPPNSPSGACVVCRDCQPTVRVFLDATRTTLGQFVRDVIGGHLNMTAASVFCGANVLYEEGEYEALAATPLAQLMSAGAKSLELHVDDLDREVGWRLRVTHCAEGRENSAAAVEGLDAARRLEELLVAEKRAADGVAGADDVTSEPKQEADSAASPVVVLTDSDGDDEDVVEID